MEVIKVVFAILMIQNGSVIEYVIKNKKKDLEKHRQSSQEKLAEYWRLI